MAVQCPGCGATELRLDISAWIVRADFTVTVGVQRVRPSSASRRTVDVQVVKECTPIQATTTVERGKTLYGYDGIARCCSCGHEAQLPDFGIEAPERVFTQSAQENTH